MLSSEGVIFVEYGKRIVLNVDNDFIQYYSWFLTKKYWIKLYPPFHGAHITITNSNIQHHNTVDWKKALKYKNRKIKFKYEVEIYEGGFTKGFIMFYMKIFSKAIDDLKEDIGVIELPNFVGNHITLGSIDKKGNKPLPYWPEMITIK